MFLILTLSWHFSMEETNLSFLLTLYQMSRSISCDFSRSVLIGRDILKATLISRDTLIEYHVCIDQNFINVLIIYHSLNYAPLFQLMACHPGNCHQSNPFSLMDNQNLEKYSKNLEIRQIKNLQQMREDF